MNVLIKTLGCSKNTVDSEYMAAYIKNAGYGIVEDIEAADFIIVNTCSFIMDAKMESIDLIVEIAELKNDYPDIKLIVAGCLGERYPAELKKEIPEIDSIVGTANFQYIVDILNELGEGGTYIERIGCFPNKFEPTVDREMPETGHYAYMKIAEGCNNACAFCIIPTLKGRYVSREKRGLLKEAENLANLGVKELILTAQDTSRYGEDLKQKSSLVELLSELAEVKGIEWIRLHYLYPDIVGEDLIKLMKNPKILPYFDIPLQHASDKMLKKMRRSTTKKKIVNLINMIRAELPNAVIRSTFIVGFPGESEEDFAELMEFLEEYKLDRVGVFKYSDEEGTPSHRMHGKVSEDEKTIREGMAMELLERLAEERQKSRLGRVERVIIDDEEGDYYICRTAGDAPDVDGISYVEKGNSALKSGDFADCLVTAYTSHDVYCVLER